MLIEYVCAPPCVYYQLSWPLVMRRHAVAPAHRPALGDPQALPRIRGWIRAVPHHSFKPLFCGKTQALQTGSAPADLHNSQQQGRVTREKEAIAMYASPRLPVPTTHSRFC